MKQALNILLAYLTCTDPVMVTKWENILASFWHKDDGSIITNITQNGNDWEFTTVAANGDETVTVIAQYQEPANFDIAKITGLQNALDDKVAKVTGKGLSTQDFTTSLKNKLDSLTQYVPPNSVEIGYINGLQEQLNTLQENINTVSDAIGGGNPIILYWNNYRLYKDNGNTELYPQAGEKLEARGDGRYAGGEYITDSEVLRDLPDGQATDEALDINILNSRP
ncbi:hypothetical protein MAR621_03115 [Maribacter dokdonensis]|uniref:hypothetical protein n=1 Tax=Maribacter dokdonensis TaxID=320912 RepID=UPI001B2E703D|nr:hypothetical protein [Maribacter dokdonensis]CAG2532921.1 hypothetical protein MAR621_03115 [Maribacter dokdonensis]